ncbi:MAG: sigma-70 family RNA polymerase sigma factor [Planctomycetota bacterium]|nr:MAG: sigma-70 family RNA polymerase sigma factor [Planctomycetota bacterium]
MHQISPARRGRAVTLPASFAGPGAHLLVYCNLSVRGIAVSKNLNISFPRTDSGDVVVVFDDSTATSDGNAPSSSTSLSLIQGIRHNDQEAWDRFVLLWGPLIYNRCRKWLPDACARDVSQEVFLAVCTGIHRFRRDGPKQRFRCWIRTVIRSKLQEHWRKNKRQIGPVGGSDNLEALGRIADPLSDDDDESWCSPGMIVARGLDILLPTLSPEVQQMVQLVYFEHYSYAEAAQKLGKTPEAVRQAMCRFRRDLKDMLDGFLD